MSSSPRGTIESKADAATDADTTEFRSLLASFILDASPGDPGSCASAAPAPASRECLITHEPLLAQHIRLPCGHAFNYDAIHKEVERQKHRRRYRERPRLGDNQLRCPYCNAVHDGLLPPCRGYDPMPRVNSPIKWALSSTSKCEHVYARGKNKGSRCDGTTLCGETRCKRHAPRLAPG